MVQHQFSIFIALTLNCNNKLSDVIQCKNRQKSDTKAKKCVTFCITAN